MLLTESPPVRKLAQEDFLEQIENYPDDVFNYLYHRYLPERLKCLFRNDEIFIRELLAHEAILMQCCKELDINYTFCRHQYKVIFLRWCIKYPGAKYLEALQEPFFTKAKEEAIKKFVFFLQKPEVVLKDEDSFKRIVVAFLSGVFGKEKVETEFTGSKEGERCRADIRVNGFDGAFYIETKKGARKLVTRSQSIKDEKQRTKYERVFCSPCLLLYASDLHKFIWLVEDRHSITSLRSIF